MNYEVPEGIPTRNIISCQQEEIRHPPSDVGQQTNQENKAICKSGVKKKRKPTKPQAVMNLAWLAYCWKMEREAVRENTMKKDMKEST